MSCINSTYSCDGHGHCNPTNSSCICNVYYELATNCSMNYFDIWKGYGYAYSIGFFILTTIAMFAFILEAFTDIRLNRSLKNMNFITKIMAAITLFCQDIYFALVLRHCVYFVETELSIDSIPLRVAQLFALVCASFVFIVWMGLAIKIKNLSDGSTKALRVLKTIIIIAVVAFAILDIICEVMIFIVRSLSILLLNVQTIVIAGYQVVISVCLIVAAIIVLRFLHKNDKKSICESKIGKKTVYLIIAYSLVVLSVLPIIIYQGIGARANPWGYITFNSIFCIISLVTITFNFLVIENHATGNGYCSSKKDGDSNSTGSGNAVDSTKGRDSSKVNTKVDA